MIKKKNAIPQTVEAFYECAYASYECNCTSNCVCRPSGGGAEAPVAGAIITRNNTNSSTNSRTGPDSSFNWS